MACEIQHFIVMACDVGLVLNERVLLVSLAYSKVTTKPGAQTTRGVR